MTTTRRGMACYMDGPEHAPVVVLIHPIATCAQIWSPQLAVWSQSWRVVRVDLPGHGASPSPEAGAGLAEWAEELAQVLDRLHVERAAVLGLSLGGMVAQAFALQHADRLSALVLAHTSAQTAEPVKALWAQRVVQAREGGVAGQVEPTLARWFTRSFIEAAPLTVRWVADQICSTSLAGYEAAVHAIQGLDHLERLAEVQSPTLVVAGADDTAAPPSFAEAIVARMPNARLAVIEHAAHLGNVEQPLIFTERVGDFLSQALAEQ